MKKVCLLSSVLAGLMCLCTTDGYSYTIKDTDLGDYIKMGCATIRCPTECHRTKESIEKTRKGDGTIFFSCADEKELPCDAEITMENYTQPNEQSSAQPQVVGQRLKRTKAPSRSATSVKVPQKVVYKEIYFDDDFDMIEE